ncbi:MAG: hypothetical protein A2289_24090 [Deltaproteobacteria bacterium RIFOXYA12_FULL_58_15]|nr:MAG: hypothetical protein A2289_24090 [Deltaproteobacteria bacterium RIFOXYA12_FULL_58_15]OGR08594.1 MAG: hypothetical protein A2341_14120 [Deltaproteobacteria bacterium RIFOXYB12_FULL_58_9]
MTEGVDTRITILHTSDIHSRLFPFELAPTATDRNLGIDAGNAPYGGAARLGYLLKRERARSGRVLHVDSGDCFQGAPIFNVARGAPELRTLGLMQVDAVVVGNHEFDAGVNNYVEQLRAWSSWDNLAANYIFSDPENVNHHELGELAQPFSLYNLDGIKVAVIGMANLGSLSSIGEGGNSLQITPSEQNEIVRSYVNLLHSSVDLIVVLSHLGLTEDEELVRGYEKTVWSDRVHPNWKIIEDLGDGRVDVWIPGVRGIDIVMGGHLHVVLNPPKLVRDVDGREVPIVHSGAFSKYLGRLDVVVRDDEEFGGKKLVAHKYQVFPVDGRLARYEDIDISRMLVPYLLDVNQDVDLRRIVAYAPRTIMRRSQGGSGDSGLGNLVTDSMRLRRQVEAEIGFTNTLGIRDNFYRGPITLEDMFNVFPFENTLTIMYLSGREVQDLVDYATERAASRGCQAQAQSSGLAFTMNCAQVLQNNRDPDNWKHPGEEISINGEPLNLTATYKVATNDYIANGGSGFKVLKRNTTKLDTGVPMRSALIDYLGLLPSCAIHDIAGPQYCLGDNDFSQATCTDVVDCDLYLAACSRGQIERLPRVCLAPGDNEPCPCPRPLEVDPRTAREAGGCGAQTYKGPYADSPCVAAESDGHIKLKTAEDLDQLDDENETEIQQ